MYLQNVFIWRNALFDLMELIYFSQSSCTKSDSWSISCMQPSGLYLIVLVALVQWSTMTFWRRCKPLDLCQCCNLIQPELAPEALSPLHITSLQLSGFHLFPTTLQLSLHCASAPVVPHSHNSHHLLLFLISTKSSFCITQTLCYCSPTTHRSLVISPPRSAFMPVHLFL